MIKFGLKLWSNNVDWFEEAASLYKRGFFDFIELYHNAHYEVDFGNLSLLKNIPITVHNPADLGFHEFEIKKEQLEIWEKTKEIADFFNSPYIVVHAGKIESFERFSENLKKIEDARILIENMPSIDIFGDLTFGCQLEQLKQIKVLKSICFDFSHAAAAACYQKMDYKNYIKKALNNLRPFYFHISGGDKNSYLDQHLNLWDSNFDLKWIKNLLEEKIAQEDCFLVFEVPKKNDDLENDIKNIEYFRKL